MFSILRKSRKLHLPIDLQLQLFDNMVAPILQYGSEIAVFEKTDGLLWLCTQFYKIILNLKKTTPNIILYDELGRYPKYIFVKARMIGLGKELLMVNRIKLPLNCILTMHERDLISKFQVGLKSLLRQGLSEPDFYGDLVYKLKRIVGSNNFSAQFIKIISHYKKIGYNINVLQQTACLVVNPITVGNFAFLFNCTPVGRTSDSMMVPT